MKGLTIFFDTNKKWRTMLEVFQKSWAMHMDIPLEVIHHDPPEKSHRRWTHDTNTLKLELWQEHFTEDTIFCDCDMLVRGDITDGFDRIEHIGYTQRKEKYPFNGGIVFAKYTDYSKKFLAEWENRNRLMYEKWGVGEHAKYRSTYGGMNQAALGYMLEHGWEATKLPDIYNMCEPKKWKEARMVHIKSGARGICFPTKRVPRRGWAKSLFETFWAFADSEEPTFQKREPKRGRRIPKRQKDQKDSAR